HRDQVAAPPAEAHGRAHQRGDAIDLILLARLVGGLALVVLAVAAVDQHRDRDAVDAAAFGHLGLGRAGNLVIDDFLGLARLLALGGCRGIGVGRALLLLLGAGQFVVDGHLAFAAALRAVGFFADLARAHDAALGIELLRGLRHLVVVEVGGELDAGAAGADHRGDDALDLLAQPPLVGGLPLLGGDAGGIVGLRAVGQE